MAAEPWRYEKLTWPEVNQAIEAKKAVVVPVGSIGQHGPHLPLDVDVVCPRGLAEEMARRIPDDVLVMPTFIHGYTAHVMDFPGTINVDWENFIKSTLTWAGAWPTTDSRRSSSSTAMAQTRPTSIWPRAGSISKPMPSASPATGGIY